MKNSSQIQDTRFKALRYMHMYPSNNYKNQSYTHAGYEDTDTLRIKEYYLFIYILVYYLTLYLRFLYLRIQCCNLLNNKQLRRYTIVFCSICAYLIVSKLK